MGRVLLYVLTAVGISFSYAVLAQPARLDPNRIETASVSTYVTDLKSGQTLFQKNSDIVMPIASITKLMTAMVVLDAKLPLKEKITFDTTDLFWMPSCRLRKKSLSIPQIKIESTTGTHGSGWNHN